MTQTLEAPPSASAPSGWGRWGLLAGLALAVIGSYAFGLHHWLSWDAIRSHLDSWQALAESRPVLALSAFFLAYVAVAALSLPVAALLTLLAGALFGRWLGTGVVSIASTLGATLAFLGSRYVLRGWVRRRLGDRIDPIDKGVEKDGAYYLFTLRLVPVVPFFLVNLGMGLTPLRTATFAAVSWLGMLPGTFLYVNAGTELATLDSPAGLLSWRVLGALALLGLFPLAIRKLVEWKVSWRAIGLVAGGLLLAAAGAVAVRSYFRYRVQDTMAVPLREYTNAEYPEDPSGRSVRHGQFDGRRLTLVKKGEARFDFVLESDDPRIARIVIKDVDVGLMTPSLPEWAKADPSLTRIALTDRQWNRQQVAFGPAGSPHVELSGGDGWEKENLFSAELAKNCLNAGLWEVLLFAREGGGKAMYYQGWFTFPLGHYKAVFERNTGLPYSSHWYYLEHWFDPAGTVVALDRLREAASEREAPASFDKAERLLFAGEQVRKRRTTVAENVAAWGDFYDDGHKVRYAAFIPPGKYSLAHPWKNEYRRMDRFDKAILRQVRSPASAKPLSELELVFSSTKRAGRVRFLVSGFDLEALPRLPASDYAKGLYMPMGIGVPPFYQSYADLEKNPPQESAYASLLLDEKDRWIDHHSFAIDGPVMHRDEKDAGLLHVYLLSYERHTLIAHVVVRTSR